RLAPRGLYTLRVSRSGVTWHAVVTPSVMPQNAARTQCSGRSGMTTFPWTSGDPGEGASFPVLAERNRSDPERSSGRWSSTALGGVVREDLGHQPRAHQVGRTPQ